MKVIKKEFYKLNESQYESYFKFEMGEYFGLTLYAIARSKISVENNTIEIDGKDNIIKFETKNEVDVVLETLSGPVRKQDALALGLKPEELRKLVAVETNKMYTEKIPDHIGNVSYYNKMKLIDIFKGDSKLVKGTDGKFYVCSFFIHNIVNTIPGFEHVSVQQFENVFTGDINYGMLRQELLDCIDALVVLGLREIELNFDL